MKLTKHAFLILAYDNPKTLAFLLKQLDDVRNDVYLHFDAKCKLHLSDFTMRKSKLYFVKRVKVFWGDYSTVEAELRCLKMAVNNGPYNFYHLVTGTTICIKPQDVIHSFYDKNPGRLFVSINWWSFPLVDARCKYYYPLISTNVYRKSRIVKALSRVLGFSQKILFINRRKRNNDFPSLKNGWQWWSIPDDFARYVLSQNDVIYRNYHHTLSPEESFIQNLAFYGGFKDRIYKLSIDDDHCDQCKTYVEWQKGGRPKVFSAADWNRLQKIQNCFFARKFSDASLPEIDGDI